ncbi:DUF5606 domain-containing protein [Microbacter margulisiae]|uniref:DUF5606 domain-containing protein n=1 Tax=Microbacter margulisiae TaxID=1350067 RepID=A0A7W5H1X9_9PORP|nr:DUF5606 domain-containing protein [Microbacter margulisiae]MBB3186842.1 hypothetical protein [Microbacter margulisiae]
MLKDILSVSGRPGLYKLVAHGKNNMIIESLIDQQRIAALANDRVVSLGDISIYTETDEIPLSEVLTKIKAKEEGKEASVDPKADPKLLRAYFESILPDFDKEKVHNSDIKKMIVWYNLLVKNGLTDFDQTPDNKENAEEAE